jgi:ABC-2 type transport system ATP-binding protein
MLWDYVRELHADGVTVILTTHYLEEAEELCDRIAVIDRGAVIADEPTGEMVARLDRKTLVIQPEAPVEAVPAMPPGVEATLRADGALALVYRRTEHDAGRLLALAQEAGVRVRDIRTEEPDLEDAFVSLVKAHDQA